MGLENTISHWIDQHNQKSEKKLVLVKHTQFHWSVRDIDNEYLFNIWPTSGKCYMKGEGSYLFGDNIERYLEKMFGEKSAFQAVEEKEIESPSAETLEKQMLSKEFYRILCGEFQAEWRFPNEKRLKLFFKSAFEAGRNYQKSIKTNN